jgi:hypothetical protein
MFGKLLVMGGEQCGLVQPDPIAHFANSRKALRRFFMTWRITSI